MNALPKLLVLIACFTTAALGVGCGNAGPPEPAADAPAGPVSLELAPSEVADAATLGRELKEAFDHADKRQASAVTVRIDDELKAGRLDRVANLILHQGEHTHRWQAYAEVAFAEAWRGRGPIPLTMGATPRTLAALRKVARTGRDRNARIAAAMAISRIEPELAREVLLAEYGHVHVRKWPFGGIEYYHYDAPTGMALGRFDVQVPEEMTSFTDMSTMLTRPARRELEPARLARAANLYNRHLLQRKEAGKWRELRSLTESDNTYRLARECWEQAADWEEVEKARNSDGAGLFGE